MYSTYVDGRSGDRRDEMSRGLARYEGSKAASKGVETRLGETLGFLGESGERTRRDEAMLALLILSEGGEACLLLK